MSAAHTPGPWHRRGAGIYAGDALLAATGDDETPGNEADVQVANAQLMACAPAMLAFLDVAASECAECGGSGLVTRFGVMVGGVEGDADDQPCPDCGDVRSVIREARGQ